MVAKRQEELSKESKAVKYRLQELDNLLNQHELTDSKFDLLRDKQAGSKTSFPICLSSSSGGP